MLSRKERSGLGNCEAAKIPLQKTTLKKKKSHFEEEFAENRSFTVIRSKFEQNKRITQIHNSVRRSCKQQHFQKLAGLAGDPQGNLSRAPNGFLGQTTKNY